MIDLTLNETVVLLAVLRLKGNAYGVSIREEIAALSNTTIVYGTLYSYLDQLFRKGYLSKHHGKPTAERGGRRKIFYRLTSKGQKALRQAYEIQKELMDEMGNWILEF